MDLSAAILCMILSPSKISTRVLFFACYGFTTVTSGVLAGFIGIEERGE